MQVWPQKRWTMLPEQDNQRANAKHHRSEIHAKISRSIHMGVEILPCMASCWLDKAWKCFKTLIPVCLFWAFSSDIQMKAKNPALRGVTSAIAKNQRNRRGQNHGNHDFGSL